MSGNGREAVSQAGVPVEGGGGGGAAPFAAVAAPAGEGVPLRQAHAHGMAPDGAAVTVPGEGVVDVSGFSVHPGSDGYTWLACVRCGPEDYGTALVCLDDAHPLRELVAAMAAHVCGEPS